jgi:hypothetical protein
MREIGHVVARGEDHNVDFILLAVTGDDRMLS